MIQALYRPRKTGKTTELVSWLIKVKEFLLVVKHTEMKREWVSRGIPEERIIVYTTLDKFKSNVVGHNFERIGIDNFWYLNDPTELVDYCSFIAEDVVIVLDKDEHFKFTTKLI